LRSFFYISSTYRLILSKALSVANEQKTLHSKHACFPPQTPKQKAAGIPAAFCDSS
jgi:hypothetical protein